MQTSWNVMNSHWTLHLFLFHFFNQGISFIVFPMSIPRSFPLLLGIQSFAIAISALAIYGIALNQLKNGFSAFLLASSYFIYFPVSGVNWFDFHYQMFFVPLFLFAFYAFLKEKYKVSILLFVLSGMVRFPYSIFPAMFSLMIVLEQAYNYFLRKDVFNLKKVSSFLLLFAFTISYLLIGYYLFGISGISGELTIGVKHVPINYGGIPPILYPLSQNLDNRIFTILLIYSPFLFLPFLSRRWVVFLLPSMFLALYSMSPFYIFPLFSRFQDSSGIIPFVYLGTIDAISYLTFGSNSFPPHESQNSLKQVRTHRDERRKQLKIVTAILVFIILLGTVFLPYSPLNKYSSDNFAYKQMTDVNSTLFQEYSDLINLIPENSSRVLFQNDMPQVLPRPETAAGLLIGGMTVPSNFTFNLGHGMWKRILPQYAIANTVDSTYNFYMNNNPTMHQLIQQLYSSGEYGILGEASGIILLEKNYTGPPKVYVPYNAYYPASSFARESYTGYSGGNITLSNITGGKTGWFGPYTTLLPGTYNVTFYLQTTNNSPNNSINLDISAGSGAMVLGSESVSGSHLSSNGSTSMVNISFYVGNIRSSIEFRGINVNWNGTLKFIGVKVNQFSPGFSTNTLSSLVSMIPSNSDVLAQIQIAPILKSDYVLNPFMYNYSEKPFFILYNLNLSTNTNPWSNLTINVEFQQLYSSGEYGILGEASGIILLEKNYTGPPKVYVPYNAYYPASSFARESYTGYSGGNITLSNITGGKTGWFGPYTTLLPGTYNVTFYLQTTNNSPNNSINLDISAGSGKVILDSKNLSGNDFKFRNTMEMTVLPVEVKNAYIGVEYRGYVNTWSGKLTFSGVMVTEISS
ncbi:MAG: DUF2079 domain-containing protein [Candidatus Thermoplasmatota archaeon]|nr:DUF2079 domain-containing protein [Candidatus Thermoplasmatota archaeon]